MTKPPLSRLNRRQFLAAGSAAAAVGALGFPHIAQAQATKVMFTCDFRMYGETAPWFYGKDLGLFEDLGIDATVDGSSGSVDAIKRVASGAYDFGCADLNSLVEFAAQQPDIAPKMIMVLFERPAQSIISLKSKGIDSLAALKGKRLGVTSTDGGSRIFPSLLRYNEVDGSDIERVVTTPPLRDALLLQDQADAVIGFDYTTTLNLMSNGIAREDIEILPFADYGFNFYANGLIASQEQIEKNPELVKRIALAAARTWLASLADPDATIAAIKQRDDLIDTELETTRLHWVLDEHVFTPEFREKGLGTLEPDRLARGVKTVAEGLDLPRTPEVAEVYDGSFLPPLSERQPNI
ncbi:ABC transporter substrate-binding protein [Amorphus sp. 3PC139-8]|uniref:ABC transporter substrate-binding protein n=1 Tax=Amorphus sp. 3PC139-8 TaxID=2735676 RepID=UPI00345C9986